MKKTPVIEISLELAEMVGLAPKGLSKEHKKMLYGERLLYTNDEDIINSAIRRWKENNRKGPSAFRQSATIFITACMAAFLLYTIVNHFLIR